MGEMSDKIMSENFKEEITLEPFPIRRRRSGDLFSLSFFLLTS